MSPDVTKGPDSVAVAWFWAVLFSQLLICSGFLLFFRKEQLAKPWTRQACSTVARLYYPFSPLSYTHSIMKQCCV
ncbi:uncharacterized protein BJX67DRAFT_361592 [Aspergillus lucknowensis]|uniref:Cell wall alpha-1,3-glucan synthase Mok11-14/Ags1-like transmembrane domain-containing protein n=1 Tax=Aspergillus lucknowensis TaxID=176173 RepID=A0ABR4LI52_9EURO